MAKEHFIKNDSGVYFTVNTAVKTVASAMSGNPPLRDHVTATFFPYGDNVNIEGLCVSLPYQFGLGLLGVFPSNPYVFLQWHDKALNSGPVTEFGEGGNIYFFEVNTFIPLNIWVPMPAGATDAWGLRIGDFLMSINMYNTPATLNTDVLDITIFLKVRHTLTMIP